MPETYLPDNSKVEALFDDGVLTLTPSKTKFDKQFRLIITMDNDKNVLLLRP